MRKKRLLLNACFTLRNHRQMSQHDPYQILKKCRIPQPPWNSFPIQHNCRIPFYRERDKECLQFFLSITQILLPHIIFQSRNSSHTYKVSRVLTQFTHGAFPIAYNVDSLPRSDLKRLYDYPSSSWQDQYMTDVCWTCYLRPSIMEISKAPMHFNTHFLQ